jgi:thiol:disulfide interchange protein DsbA
MMRNNPLPRLSIICMLASLLVACSEPDPQVRHHTGYDQLLPGNQAEQWAGWHKPLPEGTLELTYFFAYPCPHCNSFQPVLDNWLKNKPANVVLRKIPVGLLPEWVDHARLYHVAQEKGFAEAMHQPLLDAIHQSKPGLKSEGLAKFALPWAQKAVPGVNEQGVQEWMDSDAVAQAILQDNKLIRAFELKATPTMVLRHKIEDEYRYYRINSKTANPQGGIVPVLTSLVEAINTKELTHD